MHSVWRLFRSNDRILTGVSTKQNYLRSLDKINRIITFSELLNIKVFLLKEKQRKPE